MIRFELEQLERRELLSGATVEGRTLRIVGSNTADCVDVSQQTVDSPIVVTLRAGGANCGRNPIQQRVVLSPQAVDAVFVEAMGGNDTVSVSTFKAIAIHGGNGNDNLRAYQLGTARLLLSGDAGNDVLWSNTGWLMGGDGDDLLSGGRIRDGGNGTDTVVGSGYSYNCERWS